MSNTELTPREQAAGTPQGRPSSLLLERDGGVATLTLNRPDSLNSLDVPLKLALMEILPELAADSSVRAVVLAGAGRAFCVGQDLKEHTGNMGNAEPLNTVTEHYNPITLAIAEMPKPVVAAVRGSAAGAGASLALLADFRIGGPSTSFLMAFARVGLAGDTGVTWTLPRLVGHAKATELLLLAEAVPAAMAKELGLLTLLTEDDDQVLPKALELAHKLANGPTVAYGQIKNELLKGANVSLAKALAIEAVAQSACGATEDHRNATAAFVNKEKPVFTGR